jgi:hypothetical protein
MRRCFDAHLGLLHPEGCRAIYARSTKYLLPRCAWDEELRQPVVADHDNLVEMLRRFNSQGRDDMEKLEKLDVRAACEIASCFQKHPNRKVTSKRLRRLTHAIMLWMRIRYPVGNASRGKGRAKMMTVFVKEYRLRFLSRATLNRTLNT